MIESSVRGKCLGPKLLLMAPETDKSGSLRNAALYLRLFTSATQRTGRRREMDRETGREIDCSEIPSPKLNPVAVNLQKKERAREQKKMKENDMSRI